MRRGEKPHGAFFCFEKDIGEVRNMMKANSTDAMSVR